MVKISKEEAKKLREFGVKDGENGISRTHTTHRNRITHYLCESKRNMQLLSELRSPSRCN